MQKNKILNYCFVLAKIEQNLYVRVFKFKKKYARFNGIQLSTIYFISI